MPTQSEKPKDGVRDRNERNEEGEGVIVAGPEAHAREGRGPVTEHDRKKAEKEQPERR